MNSSPKVSHLTFQPTGFFENARDFTISGGSFSQVYNYYTYREEIGLSVLQRHVAAGAMFDSAERFPPGRCHPGTRKEVIEIIHRWANYNDAARTPEQGVLWLHGPAGSGKSAIAQTIAEILQQTRPEIYGGSFFLSRGSSERGDVHRLFTTLAHQLSVYFPSLRSLINDALVKDPTLPTKSIDVQLRSLIAEPLQICANVSDFHPPIMIIDGLDECASSDAQCLLLDSISRTLVEQRTPLRFLIASRPEYWIRNSFDTDRLSSITKRVSLCDALGSDADIKKYLIDGFARIYQAQRNVMSSVPTPWPHARTINRFVEASSGQFIYASTILRFIDKPPSEYCHPCRQLDIITTPQSCEYAEAFHDLDTLYTTILEAYPRADTLKRVLGGLLADGTPKAIEIFLGVHPAEITLVLNALSSLLNVSEPSCSQSIEMLENAFGYRLIEAEISFSHLSFREFLEDGDRSGQFSVSGARFHDELVMGMFKTVGISLETDYKVDPRKSHDISNSAYYFLTRKMARNPSSTEEVPGMEDLFTAVDTNLSQFLVRNPSCDIPNISYLIQDMDWIEFVLNCYESDHIHRQSSLQCRISELRVNVALAKNRAVEALLNSDQFHVNRTLIYLLHNQVVLGSMTLQDLTDMPGCTEPSVRSDLLHCRDIIGFVYNKFTRNLIVSSICTFSFLGHILDQDSGVVDWRVNEWRDLQIWVSSHCFGSLLEDARKYGLNHAHPQLLSRKHFDYRIAHVFELFSRSELSDIVSTKFFRNKYQMAVINFSLSSPIWDVLKKGRQESCHKIGSAVIRWINRQLTSPLSLQLMNEYDENLPRRMTVVIKEIFDRCFLPTYTDPYFTKICVYNKINRTCVMLDPQSQDPSSVGISQAISNDDDGSLRMRSYKPPVIPGGALDYLQFNEEIFGDPDPSDSTERVPTINREAWYPHLASFFLHVLVKCYYAHRHPEFEDHRALLNRTALMQSLPFAQPTQSNLNALRALKALCPKLRYLWCPPVGFCYGILALLKKYPLSSTEVRDFSAWLEWLKIYELP